ncbi:MAG: dephospho-CoA kinase [Planctomycetaceae bacterium]|jgi:dephospho-CoA kinase|nr:dephospho-CoA kinase [Planctomycetaceae bacterium]
MSTQKRTIVVGLSGGIGSGKSFVAGLLKDLGAQVFDADRAGHDVLREDNIKELLRQRWGNQIFGSNGEVDRQAVASVVFGCDDKAKTELRFLQSISHPRIQLALEKFIETSHIAGNSASIVVDAALLFEAEWDQCCDKVIFVDCSESVRWQRCRERGWADEEIIQRQASQLELQEKRRRSDLILNNSGTRENTLKQLQTIWAELIPSAN